MENSENRKNNGTYEKSSNIVLSLLLWGPFLAFFDPLGDLIKISPMEIVTLIVFLILSAYVLVSGKVSFPCRRQIMPAFGFLFVGFLSFIVNGLFVHDYYQFKGWFGQWVVRGLLVVALLYAYQYKFFFSRHVKIIGILNLLIVLISIFIVLITLDANFFRSTVFILPSPFQEVVSSTSMNNPNELGRFLTVTFPIAFYYFWVKRSNLIFPLIALNLLVIILAESRMSLIVFLIQFAVLFKNLKFPKGSKTVGVCLVLILGGGFTGKIVERVEQKVSQVETYGTTLRIQMFFATLEAVKERPILGHGPGTSMEIISKNQSLSNLLKEIKGADKIAQHNTLFLVATEVGLLGLLLLITAIVSMLLSGWLKAIKERNPYERALRYSILMSVFAFLVSGLTAINFGENIGWFAVAMLIYIAGVPRRKEAL